MIKLSTITSFISTNLSASLHQEARAIVRFFMVSDLQAILLALDLLKTSEISNGYY
jgi:hypothetical protein